MLEFLFHKVADLKQTPTQMLSYEICELFKNTFFYRAPLVAASENNEQQQLSEGFTNTVDSRLLEAPRGIRIYFE